MKIPLQVCSELRHVMCSVIFMRIGVGVKKTDAVLAAGVESWLTQPQLPLI